MKNVTKLYLMIAMIAQNIALIMYNPMVILPLVIWILKQH